MKKESKGNTSNSSVSHWNKVKTDNVTNNVKRTNETEERVTGVLLNERKNSTNESKTNQLMSSNVQIHDKIESVVCTKDRVSNSLYANATSIAIRIHNAKRKIQVVDNGIGIQKVQLKEIAEYSNKDMFIYSKDISIRKKQTLTDIRKLSNAMIITSRYYNSSETYIKVFKVCHDPIICTVKRRPSQGTSVSIYGFHELSLSKWNVAFMYHLIGNIAIANPQTSFSVRDDQEKKVTMIITKPHNPIDIFKSLYKKEILGQMNNELIVGLIIHNNTKMLLVMDQHAVHERIRYEHLLYGEDL
ncbi:DNA mismatch repair protein Mlh3 [Eufriesea mexicana]|nr:DNA mismatch repair protein Mlh3 [Eufriesea mexicana]